MKDIIGGEFLIDLENIDLKKNHNTKVNIDYSSGRCALYAVLSDIEKKIGKTEVLLPDYLCDSVTKTVLDAGWNYQFYSVNRNLKMDISSIEKIKIHQKSVFVLIDYFGMIDFSSEVEYIRKHYAQAVIVADCSQSFYKMEQNTVDYSFTSLRKWFACPDGGIVNKFIDGKMINLKLGENNWSKYKLAGNVLKKYSEYIGDSVSLELLAKGEEILDNNYLCECSDTSKIIFDLLDFEGISKRRKNNAQYLHNELEKLEIEHLYSNEDTPLFVPIFINERDKLRTIFFKNNIFTPKHWPHISDQLNGTNELYNYELSLICDQRYDEKDMSRQINVLKKYILEN